MFNLEGYSPEVTDKLFSFANGIDRIYLAEQRMRFGQKYKPCALFRGIESISLSITVGVTGSKRNDVS